MKNSDVSRAGFNRFRNKLQAERFIGAFIAPSRKELIQMVAEDPTLIKRPLLVKGKIKVTGYNEEKYNELVR